MRSFAGIPVKPYIGIPYSKPIDLCGGRLPAKICPLDINWLSYGASSSVPNMGVSVNLETQTPAPILTKIVSVFIDNTNSIVPIFIYFEDTGFVAVAQPNSTLWLPVLTGLTRCVVYGVTFATGAIPVTRIFLCDQYVEGFSDIERLLTFPQFRASGDIPSESLFTNGYGSPTLGDRSAGMTAQFNVLSTTPAFSQGVLIPYTTPGKIISINSLYGFVSGAELIGSGSAYQSIYLQNLTNTYFISGLNIQSDPPSPTVVFWNHHNINVKINHTSDLSIWMGAAVSGGADYFSIWTISCIYTEYDPLI